MGRTPRRSPFWPVFAQQFEEISSARREGPHLMIHNEGFSCETLAVTGELYGLKFPFLEVVFHDAFEKNSHSLISRHCFFYRFRRVAVHQHARIVPVLFKRLQIPGAAADIVYGLSGDEADLPKLVPFHPALSGQRMIRSNERD